MLQTTFDTVNRGFGEMFPALFGGGEAQLIMTGEEILDCGVQVMGRPPGKKNTTIHLLSGGEKALAAIALRSEEHTSELQSQSNLVCRLLLEKKKKIIK